jgi:hypothetical protein
MAKISSALQKIKQSRLINNGNSCAEPNLIRSLLTKHKEESVFMQPGKKNFISFVGQKSLKKKDSERAPM